MAPDLPVCLLAGSRRFAIFPGSFAGRPGRRLTASPIPSSSSRGTPAASLSNLVGTLVKHRTHISSADFHVQAAGSFAATMAAWA